MTPICHGKPPKMLCVNANTLGKRRREEEKPKQHPVKSLSEPQVKTSFARRFCSTSGLEVFGFSLPFCSSIPAPSVLPAPL